jgi:hypothetical protein
MEAAGSHVHGVTYKKTVILYIFVKHESAGGGGGKKRHLSEV